MKYDREARLREIMRRSEMIKNRIVTVNGSAVADFTVISRTNQETSGARNDSPNTGDSGNALLSTVPIIMCSALLIIALSVRTKRRKNEK